ncbi:MAG: hypothetical protein JNJ61_25715 [Anaerolineae bacterium]|nr:hypothetical protein [Anaerolineae bacterium]
MTRLIHIWSHEPLTRELLIKARGAVMAAHPLVCANASIITSDGYGLDVEITCLCERLGVPVMVVGTGLKPSNNTSLRYYQRVICPPRTPRYERAAIRDAWIRSQATDSVELRTSDLEERPAHCLPVVQAWR